MSKIEIFTGSCHLCEEAVDVVNKAVGDTGSEIVVRSIDGPEAQAYGLSAVPSIVKDGKLVFSHRPTLEEAVRELRDEAAV
jgi:hypothetical protein